MHVVDWCFQSDIASAADRLVADHEHAILVLDIDILVNYRDDERRGLDVGVTPATLPEGRSSRAPHPSWVVDGTLTLGLSKVLYGPVSDVQRGVMVGVVAVSASQAVESRVIAVSRVHVSATVAFLTRVGGVYH